MFTSFYYTGSLRFISFYYLFPMRIWKWKFWHFLRNASSTFLMLLVSLCTFFLYVNQFLLNRSIFTYQGKTVFCFVEKIVCQLATIVRQKCAQNICYVDVRHLSLKFDQSLNCNLIRGSGLHPRTETECKVTFHLSAKPKLLKLGLSCPSTGLEKRVEHLVT